LTKAGGQIKRDSQKIAAKGIIFQPQAQRGGSPARGKEEAQDGEEGSFRNLGQTKGKKDCNAATIGIRKKNKRVGKGRTRTLSWVE